MASLCSLALTVIWGLHAVITVFKLYFTFIWDEYVTEDQFILSGVKLMYLHDSCCSVFVPS